MIQFLQNSYKISHCTNITLATCTSTENEKKTVEIFFKKKSCRSNFSRSKQTHKEKDVYSISLSELVQLSERPKISSVLRITVPVVKCEASQSPQRSLHFGFGWVYLSSSLQSLRFSFLLRVVFCWLPNETPQIFIETKWQFNLPNFKLHYR